MTRWIEVDPSVLREELDMADGGRKATIEQCVQVHGETGDIRWRHLYVDPDAPIKGGPFSVLELHRHLQWWADTFTDRMVEQNPSERWSDQHIRLIGRFNIDAELASHLTDGTIVNGSGESWGSSVKFDYENVGWEEDHSKIIHSPEWKWRDTTATERSLIKAIEERDAKIERLRAGSDE